MVVSRVFRNVARKLGHLNLVHQFSFKATVHDLPLTRLEPVHDIRNRPRVVRQRKLDQLLIDKFFVPDVLLVIVDVLLGVELNEPGLSVVGPVFVKGQVYVLPIFLIDINKLFHILLQIFEILLPLLVR